MLGTAAYKAPVEYPGQTGLGLIHINRARFNQECYVDERQFPIRQIEYRCTLKLRNISFGVLDFFRLAIEGKRVFPTLRSRVDRVVARVIRFCYSCCSRAAYRSDFIIMLRRPVGFSPRDNVDARFIVVPYIFSCCLPYFFRGNFSDFLQVSLQVTPAHLHLCGGKHTGQCLIAAHPFQKFTLVEFLNALELARRNEVTFQFLHFREEGFFEIFAGSQICLAFFLFVETVLRKIVRFVGGAARDYHAGVTVVRIMSPCTNCKSFIDDMLGNASTPALT